MALFVPEVIIRAYEDPQHVVTRRCRHSTSGSRGLLSRSLSSSISGSCSWHAASVLGAADLQAEEQRTCSELHEAGNPEIREKAEFVQVAGVKRGSLA